MLHGLGENGGIPLIDSNGHIPDSPSVATKLDATISSVASAVTTTSEGIANILNDETNGLAAIKAGPVNLPPTPPAGYGVSDSQLTAIADAVIAGIMADEIDGVALSKVFEVLLAASAGTTSVDVTNGHVNFYGRDGTTVIFSLVYEPMVAGKIDSSTIP